MDEEKDARKRRPTEGRWLCWPPLRSTETAAAAAETAETAAGIVAEECLAQIEAAREGQRMV